MNNSSQADLPRLRIYPLAKKLEQETNRSRYEWLHLMAQGILGPSEPRAEWIFPGEDSCYQNSGGVTLLPETDPPMQTLQAEGLPNGPTLRRALVLLRRSVNKAPSPQSFGLPSAALLTLAMLADNPPIEIEPADLAETLEPVIFCRESFRAWCDTCGHGLPRFWFGGDFAHLTGHSPNDHLGRKATSSLASLNLKSLISRLIEAGTPDTLDDVWNALAGTAGQDGSPIICLYEADDYPALRFRTGGGIFKPLSKKALGERLRRRREKATP